MWTSAGRRSIGSRCVLVCFALTGLLSIVIFLHGVALRISNARWLARPFAVWPEQSPQALDVLSALFNEERDHILAEYDQPQTETRLRAPPGSYPANRTAYLNRLADFVRTNWPDSHNAPLLRSLERMKAGLPPTRNDLPFEETIYSLHRNLSDMPDEFDLWRRRLSGWKVHVGGDEQMERWFDEMASREVGLGKVWDAIDRPVLKTDLLRLVHSSDRVVHR